MVLAALLGHAVLALFLAFAINRIISEDLKDQFINSVRTQARQFAQSVEANASSPAAVETLLQDATLGGQMLFAELVLPGGQVFPRTPLSDGPRKPFA